MNCLSNPFAWEDGFPPVYIHTSVSFLKHCPGFEEAKRGDMQAALAVARICAKPKRIDTLTRRYSDAVLLPVITRNRLPEALAVTIGMRIHNGVRVRKPSGRKTYSAMERLLHRPSFHGKIVEGQRYIIVDDIVTQGGTISALRQHVIAGGGMVAAVAALSCSAGSLTLAPALQDYYNIDDKFGATEITGILTNHHIAGDISELTRSQLRYLLRFKKAARIADKISYTVRR